MDSPLESFAYPISIPNENIPLWDGEFEYYTPDVHKTTGKVFARMLPSPDVRIEFEGNIGIGIDDVFERREKLRLGSIGALLSRGRTRLDSISHYNNEEGDIFNHCKGDLTLDLSNEQIECDKVVFHIPNYIDNYPSELRLTDNTWEIVSVKVSNYKDIKEKIESTAGFGITHLGILRRLDGATFKASDAETILIKLYWFLSFARGSVCGPMLYIGSLNNIKTWEPWNVPLQHPWKKGTHGWMSSKNSTINETAINQAFQGFIRKSTDDYWRPCLFQAIHWYTEVNRSTIVLEGAIALLQLDLELISWAILEETSPDKTKFESFDKMKAHEKIRDTLKRLSIPTDIDGIPLLNQYLDEIITDDTPKDGPTAITSLRNAIVHPRKNKRSKIESAGNEVKYAARAVGLNYILLALLKIIGYNGKYLNHNSWNEEPVPWSRGLDSKR
ncbi:MAG: hypothetical protein A4E48_00319 [Methanosaeta sp. PtaU1.Bin060]|nr:MAG: hypothetical protein A4E45_02087 [Methanosaeta sp. PtaB.Bin039]OPY54491.1 MAG: hypothetical protein A4E48_00319 [Methanosaeta sp. PtaU1.Bin060]